MKYGDDYVIAGSAIILWDGITRPEANDSGTMVHSLKVAMLPSAPEITELNEIATNCLNKSEFRGTLPPGGGWPFGAVDPQQFEGALNGYVTINPKTYKGAPQVFDVNRVELAPQQYASQLYPGAIVEVLVHAFPYNNKNKGISLGLDGIRILDATAPRLAVGGINAAEALGGGAAAAPPAAPGLPPAAPGLPPAAPGLPPAAPGLPPAAPGLPPAAPGLPPAAPGLPPAAPGLPPAAPGTVVTPAHNFLTPQPGAVPGSMIKQMTAAAAGATYESMIAAGWTDETLIANGYMTNDVPL